MKFTVVEKPKGRIKRQDLQGLLETFASGNGEAAIIEFSEKEYVSVQTCYSSLHGAIKASGLPVRVTMLDGQIYLIKIVPEEIERCNQKK